MKPRGREPADIAHELRSPLNAIKAWAHVLEGHLQDAGPEVQRALEGIRTGVQEQVLLIEELLERAPRGKDNPER